MDTSAGLPRAGEGGEKPGWFLTAGLFGVLAGLLRFVDIWSWWAALWGPLFVLAAASGAHEWRLTARVRWRVGFAAWVLLVVAHLGLVRSLAAVGGLLPF
ncbi:hypothetical protein [Streptomyces sp. RerS4]|uniref:hypothetical protein n=1 Tax=Streptomyces sp. RerS4 TaxID=2942449 RepID=UPI00201BED72|nr:hypothetical protein [Streptomyces sp. RerS4]UQX05419.1 hypothetical protein M4D82_33610 [Streptomyces sp. RerS4]